MGVVVPLDEAREPKGLAPLFEIVDEDMKAINRIILDKAVSDVELIPKLTHHLVNSGGKRLRPMLAIASSKLCGYEGPKHITTAAAIEFAVQTLGVSDIVVCGHSQCGAMTALLDETSKTDSPHLSKWLEIAAPVRALIENNYSDLKKDSDARTTAAAEENVLFAVENLRTYPAVAQKLENDTLRLHAWFFKINTAELFAYDPEAKQFERLVGDSPNPVRTKD